MINLFLIDFKLHLITSNFSRFAINFGYLETLSLSLSRYSLSKKKCSVNLQFVFVHSKTEDDVREKRVERLKLSCWSSLYLTFVLLLKAAQC